MAASFSLHLGGPVPGASSFGSSVDGGGSVAGRTSANVCALTLGGSWLLFWVVRPFAVPSSFIPDCECASASALLGAGGAEASSGS